MRPASLDPRVYVHGKDLTSVPPAGCHANIMLQKQPKQQVDMVKDAFWDYVARATATAEDSLVQIRESQLGKEVK